MSVLRFDLSKHGPNGKKANPSRDNADFLEFLSLATHARLVVLRAILRTSPKSLYELAKNLGRGQATILRDARALEAIGLIELLKVDHDGRSRLRPVVKFDLYTLQLSGSTALRTKHHRVVRCKNEERA